MCLACGQQVWTKDLLHFPPSQHRDGCMVDHDLVEYECLTDEDLPPMEHHPRCELTHDPAVSACAWIEKNADGRITVIHE